MEDCNSFAYLNKVKLLCDAIRVGSNKENMQEDGQIRVKKLNSITLKFKLFIEKACGEATYGRKEISLRSRLMW